MAYFTLIPTPRDLTAGESTQVDSYMTAQQTAGTTNGNLYTWALALAPGPDPAPAGSQNVRMWSTSESATGYQALFAGFSPAISVAVY
jgi:hypothetical protein